ncbi:uncharacterized protein SCHCODRAFT_01329166 [Schizophyllum commune H4-8]|uniref:uncharacterized protein n=1 Tax=Schizophyllum commune (strain H4-8 / FGSC 9210) TaxID=578458 RepID=UPI00215FCBFE|nr:uncharacterized protein SCHCODRAFT_01329166 [Schizophyllum commune H4-8]KAI5888155.1 hypothetical protein SCHCODRAFT_01329166 [Schizophyllum commune H4-8]
MRVPQELVDEIISRVEWRDSDMAHLVRLLEASAPVFSAQICANLREQPVDFSVDNFRSLSTISAICPEAMDSVWHVTIERERNQAHTHHREETYHQEEAYHREEMAPQEEKYHEEETGLARLLDACSCLRSLAIDLNMQGWQEGLPYAEQKEAIYLAMQRPTLQRFSLSHTRLGEEDEARFRALRIPVGLRSVRLRMIVTFEAYAAEVDSEVPTPFPELRELAFDDCCVNFVCMMGLASCCSLSTMEYCADGNIHDDHLTAQLLRANAHLQHLTLGTVSGPFSRFPKYDLSHIRAVRSLTTILETRVHGSAIENVASTIRTIRDVGSLDTFTLMISFNGERNVVDLPQWIALEDALLGPDGRAPRLVNVRQRNYTECVSAEDQVHFQKTIQRFLSRLNERGILDVIP